MKKILTGSYFGKRPIFILITFFFLGSFSTAFAQQEEKNIYHPLTNSFLFALEYSTTFSETDYDRNIASFAWRGSAEYFLPLYSDFFAGIRGYGGTGYLTGKRDEYPSLGFPLEFKTSIDYIGAGIEGGYRVAQRFYPYAMVALTYLYFYPRDINGLPLPNYRSGIITTNTAIPTLEVGARYFVNDNVAVQASLTHNFFSNDYLDDLPKGYSKDAYSSFNIGVSYALFSEKDSDKDGVSDKNDRCPNTLHGIAVDEFGCPLDVDADGVPDYLDKCPYTSKGVKVDPDGCPLDSDNDGVPDYVDKCANTPPGARVDNTGCPVDSDKDGIPDYLDQCPGTIVGTAVDEDGCPKVTAPLKMNVQKIPEFDLDHERMVKKNIWTDGKIYVIQLSSWKDENKADEIVQMWKNKGYDAYKVSKYIPKYKSTYYRVRLGHYNSLREAEDAYKRLNLK